jgi:hypothetical protein
MNPSDAPPTGHNGSPSVTSIYLWGSDRRRLNATARILAVRLDPEFHWVEAVETESDPVEGPIVPKFAVMCGPKELAPSSGISTERLWSYLKPRGQRRAGEELQDFLRMPEPIQRAVASMLESRKPGPRVLVLANLDLVSAIEDARPRFVGHFIEFLNSHDISLLVTATGRPLLERIEFEYSFTTSEALPERFRTDAAVCQWGDCSSCIVRLFPQGELVCLSGLAKDPTFATTSGPGSPRIASH